MAVRLSGWGPESRNGLEDAVEKAASAEARLRREGALILAECKNWRGKCGKNEFVENRSRLHT